MAIVTKYRSKGAVRARYVAKSHLDNTYYWCEQSFDRRYDVAQGTCDAEDLTDDIREICDAYHGVHYACEWPITEEQEKLQ